jgi:hypothetical protein
MTNKVDESPMSTSLKDLLKDQFTLFESVITIDTSYFHATRLGKYIFIANERGGFDVYRRNHT